MNEERVYCTNDLHVILNDIKFCNKLLDWNWSFHIYEIYFTNYSVKPGWLIQLGFERPDCNSGIIGTGYGRLEFIEQGTSVSGVVKTAWLLFELIVRHELMEAFTYKNARIFNPHNKVEDLAKLDGNNLNGKNS